MATKTRKKKAEQQTQEKDAAKLIGSGGDTLVSLTAQDAAIKEMAKGIRGLEYYIPAPLSKAMEVPNPAATLHTLGFVWNDGSCWLMSESQYNLRAFDVLTEFWDTWTEGSENVDKWNEDAIAAGRPQDIVSGVRYRVFRYHPEELEDVQNWAWERLAERIRAIHTSLITRIANAADRLAEAQAAIAEMVAKGQEVSPDEYEAALLKREGSTRLAIEDAIKGLEGAIGAAEAFDAEEKLADLFSGLVQAIRSEAASLKALTEARGGDASKVATI